VNGKAIGQLAGATLLRAWLVFSTVAALGFWAGLCIDHDDPLRSDDPYIFGCVFGVFAACLAAVYSVSEGIARHVGRTPIRDVSYAAVLAAWCLLLWGGSLQGGEAAPWLAFWANASFIVGALTYPLCRCRPPRAVGIVVSCVGVLFLVMYVLMVCVRVHRL